MVTSRGATHGDRPRALTDRERVLLRSVALPTYLAARTMHEAARVAGTQAIDALTALAEAEAWLEERRGRRGAARARRVYRTRAARALEAAQLLDLAVDRARAWAVRFAREMAAVRDAEADYIRALYSTPAVQW